MISLAAQAHEDQFDKSGQPYILHTLKVMHYLKTDDEELKCIAVGHDLIEDCPEYYLNDLKYCEIYSEYFYENNLYTYRHYLRYLGFTDRIINGIVFLTKITGETYDQYKEKVKSNPDSILVKMADLRHNSDIRRLKGITSKDIERTRKYFEFYLELVEISQKNNKNE